MQKAVFHSALSNGTEDATAWSVASSDGVSIRLCVWWPEAPKGTVIIYTGRTEYGEKYGNVASEVLRRGYALVSVDWRGQGGADRLLDDPHIGHVAAFGDYQKDADAALGAISELDLPRPWFVIAHSMGGAIGLRHVLRGLDAQGVAFSAPMWGIYMSPTNRILSRFVPQIAKAIGRNNTYLFGMSADHYVLTTPYSENVLTSDRDQYAFLQMNAREGKSLSIGGPSYHWFAEALSEMRALQASPKPDIPVLVLLGSREETVDPTAVKALCDNWPSARLEIIPDARHELMMERDELRGQFFTKTFDFFESLVAD